MNTIPIAMIREVEEADRSISVTENGVEMDVTAWTSGIEKRFDSDAISFRLVHEISPPNKRYR